MPVAFELLHRFEVWSWVALSGETLGEPLNFWREDLSFPRLAVMVLIHLAM